MPATFDAAWASHTGRVLAAAFIISCAWVSAVAYCGLPVARNCAIATPAAVVAIVVMLRNASVASCTASAVD